MAAPHSLTAIGTDPDALEAFYREHVEAVQRFVARRVSDPHLAADLTADVFLEAIESAAGYRSDLGPPRAWLFGVARNVLAMHVRRGIREARAVGRIQGRRLLDPDSVQRIVERIDAERDARELLAALDDLEDGPARRGRAGRRRRPHARRGGRGPRSHPGRRARPPAPRPPPAGRLPSHHAHSRRGAVMTQLDTYETALLAELRAVVAERPARRRHAARGTADGCSSRSASPRPRSPPSWCCPAPGRSRRTP